MKFRYAVVGALFLAACGEPAPAVPPPAPAVPPPPRAAANAPDAAAPAEPKADANLLPRRTLFGAHDRAAATVSPDGTLLAYLSETPKGKQLVVAPADAKNEGAAVSKAALRGVSTYAWVGTGSHLVYTEDTDGSGALRAFVVSARGGEPEPLTPAGKRASILHTSPRQPNAVLLLSNERDGKSVDVVRVDAVTKQSKIVLQNDAGFTGFVADESLRVRLARKPLAEGGYVLFEARGADTSKWPEIARFDLTESASSRVLGFDAAGRRAFLLDNRGRANTALTSIELSTKRTTVLAEEKDADITSVLFSARGGAPLAVASFANKRAWRAVDKSVTADLDTVARAAEGDMEIVSQSYDDKVWIARFRRPESPARFFRYTRGLDKHVGALFSSDRLLETSHLAETKPFTFKARDGLELHGLLTAPSARPAPLVVWVHSGPWSRDEWAFNAYHQLFASRGYAALSVNYRGSRGFGRAFLNAGNQEWGGKMQDDLVDALGWAVAQGVADKTHVAIGGVGYGGYAALLGLGTRPDLFACGVDLGGPTNLAALLSHPNPAWALPGEPLLRIGDPSTPAGKAKLLAASPSTHVEKIRAPVLMIEGANDPLATQTTEVASALARRGVPATYLVMADEGIDVASPRNRIAAAAAVDVFLARCVGGPFEPIGGDVDAGAVTTAVGADPLYAPALKATPSTR